MRPVSNFRNTCCSNWTRKMAEKGVKQKGELKTARIPIKIVPVDTPLRKPEWIRVKAGNSAGRFGEIKTSATASRCRPTRTSHANWPNRLPCSSCVTS